MKKSIVETVHENKRCRGKRVFSIVKGTSIIRAVENMIAKRNEMISDLIKNTDA